VRDDLDGTCRTCESCHESGLFGAPVPEHRGLPPLHLEKISCQACHIPWRFVKAAQLVASDVFNRGARIPTKGKRLWTFYGPDMEYWNHYGELEMEGYDDKPTDLFRPVYFRYKGKIYPGNRVHTTWPAIQIEGQEALAEPRMKDIYGMWQAHFADPQRYPQLGKIKDDNGDGVIEVNRPEEIDALIEAVSQRLKDVGYPLEGKRVVWVCNERVYESGRKYRILRKHSYEASPYGNVHKYSHDVLPARAALGRNGCTDCHSRESPFFLRPVLARPFDENGQPVTEPQYAVLGLGAVQVWLGIIREEYLKPVLYALLLLLACTFAGCASVRLVASLRPGWERRRWLGRLVAASLAVLAALVYLLRPGYMGYMLTGRATLDRWHFPLAVSVLVAGLVGMAYLFRTEKPRWQKWRRKCAVSIGACLFLCLLAGLVMLFRQDWMGPVGYVSYTVFDLGLVLIVLTLLLFLWASPGPES